MKNTLLTALLFYCSGVFAAGGVPVLGVTVGGDVALKLAACPSDPDKSKVVCWVDKPFKASTGDMLGSVHLPNPDARPEWATYAMFNATLGKTGELKVLGVETIDDKARLTIRDSISTRFGPPSQTTLQATGPGSTTWARNDIYITMLCSTKCVVSFRSPAAQAEREKQMAEHAKKNAAKPVSP